MEKYKNKYRVIVITSPDKTNRDYVNTIEYIKKKKKTFDLLSTKIIVKKDNKFSIILYGLDSKIKYKVDNISSKIIKDIIDKIKQMPIQKSISQMTLYADYHPKTSMKNLGFKNKEIASNTILEIKNKPLVYQFQVINTMYNRAKYHPYQTKDMKDAMKIFKRWLGKYKNNKL
jgi:hypothetical protein